LNSTKVLALIAFFSIHCGGATQEAHGDAAAPDGGGSSNGDGGAESSFSGDSGGGGPMVAAAFVASSIASDPGAPQLCPFASRQDWIDVGSPATSSPVAAPDGSTQQTGRVAVACTVHATNGGFDVQLNAALSGAGSVTIASSSPVDAASGAQGVTGTFASGQRGRYSSDTCTIAFTYNGAPIPLSPPIAPGRIWGHLACPNAQRSDLQVMGPDGGTASSTCDAEADFLFENCAQ
jgi:hypothetical protein